MSEPEQLPPNVVPFKPRDPNAPLAEFQMRYRFDEHEHGRFLINERRGTIQCQLCGKFVPSFEAFCILAEQWRRQDHKFQAIKEWNEKEQKRRDREMLKRIAKQNPPYEGSP